MNTKQTSKNIVTYSNSISNRFANFKLIKSKVDILEITKTKKDPTFPLN